MANSIGISYFQPSPQQNKQSVAENEYKEAKSKTQIKKEKFKEKIIAGYIKNNKQNNLSTLDKLFDQIKIKILTEDVQKNFKALAEKIIFGLGGAQKTFNTHHNDYLKAAKNEQTKAEYIEIKSTLTTQFNNLNKTVKEYDQLAKARLEILKSEADSRKLEKALIKEGIVGYWSSVGGYVWQQYGIPYRLLDQSQKIIDKYYAYAPKVSSEESSKEEEKVKSISQKIVDLSNELTVLRETCLIYNAALKAVPDSLFPQKYYNSHMKQLNKLEGIAKELMGEKEARLGVIEQRIKYEIEPALSMLLKEKNEIIKEFEYLETRIEQIKKELSTRFAYFHLTDNQTPGIKKMVPLTDTLEKVMNLSRDVIIFKEDLIRIDSEWSMLDEEAKKSIYKSSLEKMKSLKERKVTIEASSIENTNASLENKIKTYNDYAEEINSFQSNVNNETILLCKAMENCDAWDVGPLIKENEQVVSKT